MGFVTGMVAALPAHAHDPAPLLARLDIDPGDPASRVPLDRYALLYNRVIAELGDEGFGLFSVRMPPGCFEFLCRGMLSAPTLAESLDRARRFLAIVLPDLAVGIHRAGHHAELQIAETRPLAPTPDAPGRVFAFEWLLRLIHSLSCWLVGRGLALDSVDFPFARPAHADDYALVYTERSAFIGGGCSPPASTPLCSICRSAATRLPSPASSTARRAASACSTGATAPPSPGSAT